MTGKASAGVTLATLNQPGALIKEGAWQAVGAGLVALAAGSLVLLLMSSRKQPAATGCGCGCDGKGS